MTPKPVTPIAQNANRSGAYIGGGPWALSALPECFTQESRTTGPRAYVFAHLPRGATPVYPGSTVLAADCRVFEHEGEVWAWRGDDRLRVPAPARLYQVTSPANQRTLALLQGSANAFDLRVYRLAPAP